MERAAAAEEIAQIKTLLREALMAGAVGFSTTNTLQHVGYRGRPLACRLADINEMTAYAGVLKELGRARFEIALTRSAGMLSDDEYQLLDLLLTESGRPVTWLSARSEETLRKAAPLTERGAICQLRCTPTVFEFNLKSPASTDGSDVSYLDQGVQSAGRSSKEVIRERGVPRCVCRRS